MRSIYTKALWDQRRSLPAWASALALMVFLEAAMWPSLSDMSELDAYLDDFPSALKEVFSIDQMSTGQGFLNAELFTLMLPMMFVVFGVLHGARMVAGEEAAGTLDLLLVTPLSTTRFLVEEALALTTSLAALGAAVFTATILGSAAFGLQVSVVAALSGSLAVTLLGLEFGVLALAIGALTGRRGLALGLTSALGLATYVLYVAGMFVDALSPWRVLSPFDQALSAGPLAPDLPASMLWLVVVSVLACLAVLPLWARRDIGASS
ncbi:ABC transporter permease [Nocardioides sp.]|uniref:ABC transporter permease n=1 Tax=Nocardioides sp. TaxID=35761 RepID=UPI003D13E024